MPSNSNTNKGKGSHPNSRKNLKPRAKTKKPSELTKTTSISINQEEINSIRPLGDGNLSEGIKILNRVYNRTYPDGLLYPQSLILEMELAIADGDTKWQVHLDYLYSWAADMAATEIADGVTKIGDSWIV